MSRKAAEHGVGGKGVRRQIQQPGGDDAAMPPQLGDGGHVEFVLIVFPRAQGRRFRIEGLVAETDAGTTQHVEAFSVGGHETVLDGVVHHFDEMPGSVRSTVEEPCTAVPCGPGADGGDSAPGESAEKIGSRCATT